MWIAKLARIVAVISLIVGLLYLAIGFSIATEVIGPYEYAMARYLPGKASSGEAIDVGIYTFLASLALGTLAEIALKK
jgi:hypothetical protein